MDDELVVAVPKPAFELVRPDNEPVLTGADMEEKSLDCLVVGTEENRLQSVVEFTPVEPSGNDPRNEG